MAKDQGRETNKVIADLNKQARGLLAKATQHDSSEIPDDASISNWDAWNSLVHMHLILAMEEQLGSELTPEEILNISTLQDIVSYLDKQTTNQNI